MSTETDKCSICGKWYSPRWPRGTGDAHRACEAAGRPATPLGVAAHLDALLADIEAGRSPAIPEHMRDLVERAARAGRPADIGAWAEQLAAGIAAAEDA